MKLEILEMHNLKEMSLSAEIFLSCSILQLTFYAISTSHQKKHNFVILSQQIYYTGVLILFFSVLLIINENSYFLNMYGSNNSIINDYLSFYSKLFVGIVSLIFLIIISAFYEDKTIQNNFEYVMLILISVLGIFLLCSSNDLITAYLSIELQSIAFYIMSAFKKNSTYSIESSLKYFVVGSLSSAFFLMGSAIIYGCLGSLNFSDLKIFISILNTPINYLDILQSGNNFKSFFSHLNTSNFVFLNEIYFHYINSLNEGKNFYGFSEMNLNFLYLGFIFLCLSLFIKLALAPFHLWSLDVYEGSPGTTTAFFATVPKIGLFVLLSRICYDVFYFSFSYNWQVCFSAVAVISIFFGSFGGLEQRKLKSLLAYSSISHTGYLLLCFSSKNLGGVSIMFYYMVIFMISSLCFWSVYLFLIPKKSFYLNKKIKNWVI
jgi:NADH-quinone oxidoreductase subunit N